MNEPPPEIDWDLCTWEGSHREQLRRWSALSLRRKLEALEEMCDLGRRTLASRRRRGLAYVDPHTNTVVRPARLEALPPPASPTGVEIDGSDAR